MKAEQQDEIFLESVDDVKSRLFWEPLVGKTVAKINAKTTRPGSDLGALFDTVKTHPNHRLASLVRRRKALHGLLEGP